MIIVDEQAVAATGLEPRQEFVTDVGSQAHTVGGAEVIVRAEFRLKADVQPLLDFVGGLGTKHESGIVGERRCRKQCDTQCQQQRCCQLFSFTSCHSYLGIFNVLLT